MAGSLLYKAKFLSSILHYFITFYISHNDCISMGWYRNTTNYHWITLVWVFHHNTGQLELKAAENIYVHAHSYWLQSIVAMNNVG